MDTAGAVCVIVLATSSSWLRYVGQVRLTYGGSQAAVLGQVEALADWRRHYDPQRLGEGDLAQGIHLGKAQRPGRFALTPVYRLESGSHDFG